MGCGIQLQEREIPVNILVDTSVWCLALRRDSPADCEEVHRLKTALQGEEGVFTTGLILQELLQGFNGPKARRKIIETFAALPLIIPERRDHVEAADLRIKLRQRGVQAGTIDVLLAQLCLRHGLWLLSLDKDFEYMARHIPLSVIGM
jgi:predicted nucleic acid-binding protein